MWRAFAFGWSVVCDSVVWGLGGLDFVANHGEGGIMYNRRRCSVKTKETMWSKKITKLGALTQTVPHDQLLAMRQK